jgi:DHA2 family multidrug resistance protein
MRLGRKRLLLLSVSGFTVASMLCGASQNLNEIVVFRILQGIFGACLVPLSQALLLDTFPAEKHAKAMSIWGMGVMVAPILGPTLGGWLTEYHSWRWVFYINVPFGIGALIGIYALIRESKIENDYLFDIRGFALLGITIASIQLILDRGHTLYWLQSNEIRIELGIAVMAFYFFIVHLFTYEKRPFINPVLFRDRNFCLGLGFIFVIGIILLATLALLPPYLQNVLGYSVFDAGLILAPRGGGTMVAMMLCGRVIEKGLPPRYLIVFGLTCVVYSMWEMTGFTNNISRSMITWTGFAQGLGLGFIFVPLSTLAFATLEPIYRTEAASLFGLARHIGSSLGISIVVSQLSVNFQKQHAYMTEHLTPFNSLLQDHNLLWNINSPLGINLLEMEVSQQAIQLAYLDDFRIIMAMAILAIPIVFLLHNPETSNQPSEVT